MTAAFTKWSFPTLSSPTFGLQPQPSDRTCQENWPLSYVSLVRATYCTEYGHRIGSVSTRCYLTGRYKLARSCSNSNLLRPRVRKVVSNKMYLHEQNFINQLLRIYICRCKKVVNKGPDSSCTSFVVCSHGYEDFIVLMRLLLASVLRVDCQSYYQY